MGSIPAIAPRGPSEPGPMGNYKKKKKTLKSWQRKNTCTTWIMLPAFKAHV